MGVPPWRLLFVIKGSALNRGMNTGIENLAWKLAERGLEIHVISGGSSPAAPKCPAPRDVEYYFTGGDGFPGDHASLYRQLRASLEFDAVIGWIRNLAPLAMLEQNSAGGPRFIANEGDLSAPRRPNWKKRARGFLSALTTGEQAISRAWQDQIAGAARIAGVIAISGAVSDNVVRSWSIPRERTTVIFRGIDTAFFRPLPQQDHTVLQRPPRLLYTGNIIESKGLGDVVEGLQQVPMPVELVLCGNHQGYASDLEARIAEIGGGHRLTWAGALDREALLQQLQAADMFVFCSWSEGLGKSLLEAMACALPVVVSDIAAFADVVSDRENALVVPVRDSKSIAEAINAYLRDPALRTRCGRSARRTIETSFGAEREAEAWLTLLADHLSVRATTP